MSDSKTTSPAATGSEDKSEEVSRHFIHEINDEDIAEGGRFAGRKVHTRFPPEPNGYCISVMQKLSLLISARLKNITDSAIFAWMTPIRPRRMSSMSIAIKEDIHWLGYDWGDRFYFASDYFPQMFDFACELISKGLAYVCEQTAEQIREYRGTLMRPAARARTEIVRLRESGPV
jgi:glutaminyl-tRNA synthetase